MTTHRRYALKAAFLAIAAFLLPTAAQAAAGFATANVNMRSGPSTLYPAVTVIPVGTSVEIHGCLSDIPWCDVSFYEGRGWVAARYVQVEYQQSRVYLEPDYYDTLGIPFVTFEIGNYWDRYYRDRDF
ncbi:MAG: SH3 domain-containing protein [Pararhizobium sp.]